ncbi:MAG: gfo/Idh/MocA family oxidoreductase [Actinobacteria bacterium]|nr:gfo/Idh/MocA family oxidoreductase [Actinomycetota bacterium]
MTTRRVKTALIGLGRMGRTHAAALRNVAALDVVAVVDPSPASREAAEEFFPGVATFEHYSTAFHIAEACIVVSPTPLHPAIVREALSAGVHVLCEKPLSLDVDVARRLHDDAVASERVLQIGHWRRFSPPWLRAKQLLDQGAIGRPLWIRLSQWDANPPPAAFCDPTVSGGLAIDCGVLEAFANQAAVRGLARRIAGESVDVPDAHASARSTLIGHAVMQSARRHQEVAITT